MEQLIGKGVCVYAMQAVCHIVRSVVSAVRICTEYSSSTGSSAAYRLHVAVDNSCYWFPSSN